MTRARDILSWPFIALIRVYQVTLSPFMGGQCRYEPTCSRYAIDAYERFGPLKGTWLAARRILRCHPFVRGGYDPVPFPDDGPSPGGPAVGISANSGKDPP